MERALSWTGTEYCFAGTLCGEVETSLLMPVHSAAGSFFPTIVVAWCATCTGQIVTGNAYQMRFRESAVNLFPELIHERVNARATGELAIELPTAAHRAMTPIAECRVDFIVFLNRVDPTPPGLFRFPKSIAFQWFQQVVCYGEGSVREAHFTSLRNLLSADVFEMRYVQMDTALHLLKTLVRQGPSVASEPLVVQEELENG